VDAQDVFIVRGIGAQKILLGRDAFAEKHFVDEPEFLRGKNVRAEIQIIAFMVNQSERQHGAWRD
jgi:hypothetical protein